MEKVLSNTAYRITVDSNKGGIRFTATRRYSSGRHNGRTEYGYLGWQVTTYKYYNFGWRAQKMQDYPGTIESKKEVINFLSDKPIFSEAYSELMELKVAK